MVYDYNKKELKIGDVVMVSDHECNKKTPEMAMSKKKNKKAMITKIRNDYVNRSKKIIDILWLDDNKVSTFWMDYRFVKITPSLKQFLEAER